MSGVLINLPGYGAVNWKSSAASVAALPSSGNSPGDARIVLDSFNIYIWSGSAWIDAAGPGAGVASVTASSPLASSGGSNPNLTLNGIVPLANGGSAISNVQTDVATSGTITAQAATTAILNFTSASTKTLQGLVSNASALRVTVRNTGAGALTIPHQSSGATAANRFDLEAAKPLVLLSGADATFVYNTTSSRWNLADGRSQLAVDASSNLFSLNGAPGTVTGTNNTSIGAAASTSLTTGSYNTAFGEQAGVDVTTGLRNVAIGSLAGVNHQTGSFNIAIGYASGGTGFTNKSNQIAIGKQSRVSQDNQGNIGSEGYPINLGVNKSNPQYTLDVAGDVNVSGTFLINGAIQTPWTLDGNTGDGHFLGLTDSYDLRIGTNNFVIQTIKPSRLTGFIQTDPNAVVHAGLLTTTAQDVGSLSAAFEISDSGYAFGSGDKDYSAYTKLSVDGTDIFSNFPATTTFIDPASTDFDPTNGSASDQDGTGYDPNIDPPPSYEVWAFYFLDNRKCITPISFALSAWTDTLSNKDVNVLWNAPLGVDVPSDYYIVRNGTDFIYSPTPGFLDNNTGWGSGGPPDGTPVITYGVDLAASNGPDVRFLNTTNGTYFDTTASLLATDIGAWASGSTVTPNSAAYPSFKADGQIKISGEGYGLSIKEGSNAKLGTATLSGGTVTVSNTAVTANSRIFVTANSTSAGHGSLWVQGIVAGTGFDIKSTNASDNAAVAWMIIEAIA